MKIVQKNAHPRVYICDRFDYERSKHNSSKVCYLQNNTTQAVNIKNQSKFKQTF